MLLGDKPINRVGLANATGQMTIDRVRAVAFTKAIITVTCQSHVIEGFAGIERKK